MRPEAGLSKLSCLSLTVMLTAVVSTGSACGDKDDGATDSTLDGGTDVGTTGDGGNTPVTDGVSISEADARLHDTVESFLYVTWAQTGTTTTWVELTHGDETVITEPTVTTDGQQEVLVLGIPYSRVVDWKLKYDQDQDLATTDDVVTIGAGEISTGTLPEGMPSPSILVSEPDLWEPTGNYMMGSINEDGGGWTGGHYWKFIIDRQGRVVWAFETPDQHWTIFMRVAQSGDHIVWDEATYWADYDGGEASTVHRWYIDGTEIEEIATPGLHHAFTELPDGTLAWGAVDGSSEDLVKRAPGSDEIETIWRCRDFHAEAGSSSSCQSNTLYHHQPTDTFLYSFYTTNTLVEVDHATGASLWWAGDVRGGYAFDPPESQFSWQHGGTYTDAGTLLTSSENTHFGGPEYTVVREYEVDHDAGMLREIWSFGDGYDTYGSTAGEAHRLPDGNTLHNYGAHGSVKEVTSDGQVVWEAYWGGDRLIGRTVFLEDLTSLLPPDDAVPESTKETP